ncbi:hypothetical protein ACFL5Z_00865 [Planctomycetota bacterium]
MATGILVFDFELFIGALVQKDKERTTLTLLQSIGYSSQAFSDLADEQ